MIEIENREELVQIITKFAESGWDFLTAPSKSWLEGNGERRINCCYKASKNVAGADVNLICSTKERSISVNKTAQIYLCLCDLFSVVYRTGNPSLPICAEKAFFDPRTDGIYIHLTCQISSFTKKPPEVLEVFGILA